MQVDGSRLVLIFISQEPHVEKLGLDKEVRLRCCEYSSHDVQTVIGHRLREVEGVIDPIAVEYLSVQVRLYSVLLPFLWPGTQPPYQLCD